MWREEELNRALTYFKNYLRNRGYGLSDYAFSQLKEYSMEAERRAKIGEVLRKREKTFEDIRAGFDRLADESLRFARAERRTTVLSTDVRKAIAELRCKVWPFCD